MFLNQDPHVYAWGNPTSALFCQLWVLFCSHNPCPPLPYLTVDHFLPSPLILSEKWQTFLNNRSCQQVGASTLCSRKLPAAIIGCFFLCSLLFRLSQQRCFTWQHSLTTSLLQNCSLFLNHHMGQRPQNCRERCSNNYWGLWLVVHHCHSWGCIYQSEQSCQPSLLFFSFFLFSTNYCTNHSLPLLAILKVPDPL